MSGYCFYCGEPSDYRDDITRQWVCDDPECNKELQDQHEAQRYEEHEEVDRRWGLY